jgi:tetratricopeptide (TPR) repeat protein
LTRDDNALQASLRNELVALLHAKRHEEALALLYRALAESPAAPELQRGIDHLKNFLIVGYAKRLGGLDRVAPPIPASVSRKPEAMLVGRYIDGVTTFGDIAQTCPLGLLRTLQVLVGLFAPPLEDEAAASSRGKPAGEVASAREPASVLSLVTRLQAPVEIADSKPREAPESARMLPAAPLSTAAEDPAAAAQAEAEAEKAYRALFQTGTTAFVQRRFREAVEAFEECARLRPEDKSVLVMLRRSQQDLRNQIE